ncbi:MAG TPA: protein kinase, partial [Vicinamibacteria bacterium]
MFASALVVALVVTSLAFTTYQADRLARENVAQGLTDTRQVWETFQADRFNKLKLGIRTLSNDPGFKALVQLAIDEPTGPDTLFENLDERNQDIGADFILATDAEGIVLARSDRAGVKGEDLSKDPIVMRPLEGDESATVWRQGDALFHAVSVPVSTQGSLVGVLVAGYGINEALASQMQKLSHSEVAFLAQAAGQSPQFSVSSLGRKEEAFKAALSLPQLATGGSNTSFPLDLGGERYVAIQMPLKAAGGALVGSAVALRSVSEETASFRQFRNSLVLVSLVVMAIGLLLAYFASRQITGPVRTLVDLVERARDGSFSGAVAVNTKDEIGTLARTFNHLLADLREKDQMIGFLREGMTLMRRGVSGDTSDSGGQATANLQATAPSGSTSPAGSGTSKLERGTLFANRYEIQSQVGKGGMGVVYRALDRQLDEEVALKVLRSEALKEDPSILRRFKDETKLARRITHRNVLRTHDFAEADGVAYISMELLEADTLKEIIKRRGPLPLGVGLIVAKQMCKGLEAAHEKGVVHRDIKPQNMLIITETADLKIMDFGIAKNQSLKEVAPDSGLTSAGTVMGTPDYMPPEQAQGNPADFRSDIYSLGVVLFETFTGKLPFTGDSIMKIVMGHIQSPPPRPRSLNPKLPPDLDALILRCLSKNPADRPQTVEAILDELSSISSRV